MYELIQLTERSYLIQSPARIGLVRLKEDDVCLIDSGSDKDAGRKVRQILDRNGWKLRAIYNTHSNADHIGGNKYLQAQTGCEIFAPGIECAFTRWPVLEPSFLYGGYPFGELRHKFLLAQESGARELTPDALPEGFELIPLPGHFFDMVGYRTPDGAVYLADCLSSRETLEKYGLCYIYDVAAYLKTLELVKTLEAKVFVPSHAEAAEDIAPLAQLNIDKVHEIAEAIVSLCAEPIGFDSLLQQVFARFGLTMTYEQYVLIGSTVRSYLSWLKDTGRVDARIDDNRLLWARVS